MAFDGPKPDSVTGGCLCGSVRYKLTFPPDHDFVKSSLTCQCFQCRKNSGGLIWRSHNMPRSGLTMLSDSTLKWFSASVERFQRAFCSNCGGFLFWSDKESDHISTSVGCVDKEDLKKYGAALATARTHLWCEDAIPGVTDDLKGDKWRLDCVGDGAELM